MNKPCIQVEHVSKSFRIQTQRPFLLHELLLRMVRKNQQRKLFWALQDVSFSITPGASVGLIGGNGAGKSTLLSLISGAAHPTSGTVMVDGNIAALLELGAGFHPDLTGRENISLNASLMGFQQEEVEEKMEPIIAFSELKDFIDVPIRKYSSGMHVRLGFSVAIHQNPDILIMDEALAVGDASFQQKCNDKIREFREKGVTFFVVSHNLPTIRDLCDQALWLDHGHLKVFGDVDEVCDQYQTSVN